MVFRYVSGRFFPQRQFLLRNVCFLVMSVVLGDWLSIPFAIVPKNCASFFDGISLVLIDLELIQMVCTLNHLNHRLYLARSKEKMTRNDRK